MTPLPSFARSLTRILRKGQFLTPTPSNVTAGRT